METAFGCDKRIANIMKKGTVDTHTILLAN